MKGLDFIMKELERHWSPKEKTNCKRATARQVGTELELGLASAGAAVEQSQCIPASRMRFMFRLLSLETFCLLNNQDHVKSRSRPRLSIGFRLVYTPATW